MGSEAVAVMLNANARQVTPALAKRMAEIVGADNVFLSHSLAEADALARTVIGRGYTRVVCGGGDGTFVNTVERVRQAAREASVPAPHFGLLALGTGNALRSVIHAGPPFRDLERLARGDTDARPMTLIADDGGHHFFFAGVGHSAQLLHDYNRVRTSLPSWLGAKLAYGAAAVFRTIPRYIFKKHPRQVTVTTRSPAFYVDPTRADTLVPVPAGEVLYSGKLGTLDVSTVPELGCKIRMFPFTDRDPRMMQLRASSLSLGQSILAMPRLWSGEYRNQKKVFDFLVQDIEVEINKPTTYQHSGDEQGKVDRLRFTLDPDSVGVLVQRAAA